MGCEEADQAELLMKCPARQERSCQSREILPARSPLRRCEPVHFAPYLQMYSFCLLTAGPTVQFCQNSENPRGCQCTLVENKGRGKVRLKEDDKVLGLGMLYFETQPGPIEIKPGIHKTTTRDPLNNCPEPMKLILRTHRTTYLKDLSLSGCA